MAKLVMQSILFMFGLGENPIHKQEQKTDREYLEADWKTVGDDLKNAMNAYGQH